MAWLMASRRRVAAFTILLLALLDLGRSAYARIGYARPVSVWQPDPSAYADLTWPPGADLSEETPAGRRIYAQRCAVCHGPDGRGNGPAAPSMIPRPRDFTRGEFKYKSTPPGQPPSDDDLIRTVSKGLQASAMPAWGDLLTEAEVRAVVAYIKTFSPVFGATPQAKSPQETVVPPRVAPDSASIERGRIQFLGQCASCHGPDGRAGLLLKDNKEYPVVARDVTAPWTFRGGSAPQDLWIRLTTGLAPGPMPSFADTLTASERWDVVNYILSLARTPPWESGGRLSGPGFHENPVARGRYFIHAMMCGLCHTPINRTGIYRGDDFYLSGGMRVGAYPHGVLVSPNLTSDRRTGLGSWTEAEIIEAFQNGRSRTRTLNIFDMPWVRLHRLQPDDARAIARYLNTTLTPVNHHIPAALRYGVIETIVMKIARGLPASPPRVLTYADGMFGQTRGVPRNFPQGLLMGGQWLTLLIGIVAFIFAAPPGSRFPRTWGRRLLAILGILGLLIVALLGVALYGTPGLRIIPPEILVNAAAPEPPRPDPSGLATLEQAALAERGHYLYTVTSCALCHGTEGAGGSKISWKPMGTVWSRNITPDPDTGIGRWTDGQIARAIRSGVSADGRMLHWQGMIWDHFSNLDEEDVRALVAYLRSLPPVSRRIPDARRPAQDDCDTYTFFVDESLTPGCR